MSKGENDPSKKKITSIQLRGQNGIILPCFNKLILPA